MASKTFTLTLKGKPIPRATYVPESVNLSKILNKSNIRKKKGGKIMTSTNPQNAIYPALHNSLAGAIYQAYNKHYKLTLRPDDIWLSIVIVLSDYINCHAEEMRKLFVKHEGKKQLVVQSSIEDWPMIIKLFSDMIDENTIGSVRDWVEPNFTTTTSNDKLIGRVALMGCLKQFFAYACCLDCGIPEVTLMGELEDWIKLKDKIQRLEEYGVNSNQEPLVWWKQILTPIIDEFISSYQGNVNEKFWQSCSKEIAYGSGSTAVTGWIAAFTPFYKGKWRINTPNDILQSGKYGMLDTGDFVTGTTVEVPLKINDNGHIYDAFFYAGGMVNTYDIETNMIRPSFDFAMFKMPDGTVKDNIDWNDMRVKPVV